MEPASAARFDGIDRKKKSTPEQDEALCSYVRDKKPFLFPGNVQLL
jgi:hypothetical protein